MNWREVPLFRLLCPLVAGILLSHSAEGWRIAFAALLAAWAALVFSRRKGWLYKLRWLPGVVVTVFFLLLGYVLGSLQDSRALQQHFGDRALAQDTATLIGRILVQEPKGERLRLNLAITAVQDTQGVMRQAKGKLLAYLDIDVGSRALQVGDLLLFQGRVRATSPPLNPHQFDYQHYLAVREIHHQIFINEGWRRLGHEPSLRSRADELRQQALSALRQHLPTPDEFAVGAALSLGYKSELPEEIRNAYANTGALHVLAVSGLHVGLVQLILMALLGRVPLRGPWWRLSKTLLIVFGIWAFALITGASPSVLRAATMFTFLAVGQSLKRPTNIYNTLAASAFVLLCIDPQLIYQVGFQLSYLAVLGIVYFQPRIYRLWYIANPVGDYLWKLSAVSLAAQLGTLPISLYYFHQFPVYFVLSGLIVVPAAGLILSAALLLFAVQGLPWLAVWVGKLLYGLLYLTNAGIFLVQGLPGGLFEGIWIGLGGALLLYAVLGALIAAGRTRQFKWVLLALALLVLLAGSLAYRKWIAAEQDAVVVYHIYKQSAVDYFRGRSFYELSDTEPERLVFATAQHRQWRRARLAEAYELGGNADEVAVWGQAGFWSLGGIRLLVLQQAEQLGQQGKVKVDAVLLSQSPRVKLSELMEQVETDYVLADGSNPPWRTEQWAAEAEDLDLTFFYTGLDGALTLQPGPDGLLATPFTKQAAR